MKTIKTIIIALFIIIATIFLGFVLDGWVKEERADAAKEERSRTTQLIATLVDKSKMCIK